MIRLRTSQVELTPSDVAYTIRRIVLQRRAIRAAESAAALALQNARIESILSKIPNEIPAPLPLRNEYGSRDRSIVCEEPVVRGHRDFWDKIVVEAGSADNADIEGGDGATLPNPHSQGASGLDDDRDCVESEANCEVVDSNGERDKSKTHGDDALSRPETHGFEQKGRGGAFGGAYDGTSGGSEFCSSVSISSFNWPLSDAGDKKGDDGDSDDDPSSSEFEEDVLSESELSPHMSKLGDSGLSEQHVNAEEEASFFTLHRSFSVQLNFDGASESPLDRPSLSRSFLSSPPFSVHDSKSSSPLSGSIKAQTHPHGLTHRSLPRATQLPSPLRSEDATMGLPMWKNSDYEAPTPQRVRRYRPRTSTYSFEESEPASSQGHTEIQDANAQDGSDAATQSSVSTAPFVSDNEMTEDDDQSFRYPFLGELMFGDAWDEILNSFSRQLSLTGGRLIGPGQHSPESVGVGDSAQLLDMGTVFSSHDGSQNSPAPRGPDQSPIQYARQTQTLPVPPSSPVTRAVGNFVHLPEDSMSRIQVYNDNQSSSVHRHRYPRRPPASAARDSANALAFARLLRVGGANSHEMLETMIETERELRGRELALPERWIHNAQMARQEFDEWISLNGERRGRTTRQGSGASEEL